jgi:hypothetical protein
MWNPVARTRAHSDSSSRPSVDRSDRACSLLSWIDPRRDRWTDVEKPELRPNDGPASTGEPRRGRSTNRGTARIRLTSVAATTWRSRGRPRSSPTSSERPSRSTRIPTNHHTPMDATKYSNSVTWNDDTTLTTQTRKTAGRGPPHVPQIVDHRHSGRRQQHQEVAQGSQGPHRQPSGGDGRSQDDESDAVLDPGARFPHLLRLHQAPQTDQRGREPECRHQDVDEGQRHQTPQEERSEHPPMGARGLRGHAAERRTHGASAPPVPRPTVARGSSSRPA